MSFIDNLTVQDCINYMKTQIRQQEKYPANYKYNTPYYRKTVEYLEQVKDRPHGEWIDTDVTYEDTGDVERRCSNCKHGDRQSPSAVVPYCWYCGADMRKEGGEK